MTAMLRDVAPEHATPYANQIALDVAVIMLVSERPDDLERFYWEYDRPLRSSRDSLEFRYTGMLTKLPHLQNKRHGTNVHRL